MTKDFSPSTPDTIAQAAHWRLRLAEDDLSDRERLQLEQWLQADFSHADALSQAIEAWRAVDLQAADQEMIALRNEALSDAARVRAQRQWRRNVQIAVSGMAAAVLLVAGVGALWLAQASSIYSTNVGERRMIVLSDGSKLTLDALTRVRVHYSRDRRQLWLEQGRAKFEVAKNPLRPFTVVAEGKLVVATGTQFSVEVLRQRILVDLYEGHVAVMDDQAKLKDPAMSDGLKGSPGVRYLAPGEELSAARRGDQEGVRPLSAGDTPTWESGQLTFVDEPLSTVAERANRYSDDKIVVADEAAGEQRISGVFAAGDTAAIVNAITTILPVRATEEGAVIRLSITREKNNTDDGGVRSPR